MTKLRIYGEEWYPVYTVTEHGGTECEIPDDLLARYETYRRGWLEVQDELLAIIEEAESQA